jgi:hypothetical protein
VTAQPCWTKLRSAQLALPPFDNAAHAKGHVHGAQHRQQFIAGRRRHGRHQVGEGGLVIQRQGVFFYRLQQTLAQLMDFLRREVVQKQLTHQTLGVGASQHHRTEIRRHGGKRRG